MNIYQILNTLILALSIATILITLVAFIIYQIKRLNTDKKDLEHGFRLESIYFRRFSPKIENLIKDWEKENESKKNSTIKKIPFLYLKLSTLFGILATVLVVTLTVGNLGQPEKEGKNSISEKVLNEQAHKVSIMRKKGLLKKFSFSASQEASENELKPLDLKSTLNINDLTPIAIVKDPILMEDNESKHNFAYKNWITFFKKNQITYVEVLASEQLKGKSKVFILPQLSKIDLRLASEVVHLHRSKEATFLFTGPVGIDNSEGQLNLQGWNKKYWFEEFAELKFEKNPRPKIYLASQFASTPEIPFHVPPGQVLPWTSTDNRYLALNSDSNLTIAFETSYIGEANVFQNQNIVKSLLHRDHSLAWMAWDPIEVTDNAEFNQTQNYFFQQSLAILSKQPITKLSWWPNGSESIGIVSVDSEDEFPNISNLQNLFNKYKAPATLFLVAEFYEKYYDLIDPLNKNIEFASHGDNHDAFKKQSAQTQFNRIQKSRHIIEQFSARPVKGFRPPYEKFDKNTLDAVAANQLSYIFSGQQCFRYSPCELGNGTVIFPRILLDDYALIRDRTLISPTNMFNAMASDIDRVQQTGGAYFLSLHTQIFGVEPYLGVVDKVLHSLKQNPKIQLMTFSDLADWWRQRNQIKLEIKTIEGDSAVVQITNAGSTQVNDFDFTLFNVEKIKPITRDLASKNASKCLVKNNHTICSIEKLGPSDVIEFTIEK